MTLAATTLTGGNSSVNSYLNVTSNVNFTGIQVNSSANVFLNGANLYINSAATFKNTSSFTGNATFSNTLAVLGNVTFSNSLTVSGNAAFQNASFVLVTTGTSVINSTSITANIGFYNNLISIGNSSVNVQINSTAINGASFTGLTGLVIGANLSLNTTSILLGNSTINVVVNSFSVVASNSSITSIINTSGISIGSNVILTGNSLSLGNSTVNISSNSTALNISNGALIIVANATAWAMNVTGNSYYTGNSYVNGNMTVTGNFVVSGNVIYTNTSFGNVIPSSNLSYYLGNTLNRWQYLYCGNGDFSNSVNMSANLTVGGSANVTGNINVTGTLVGNITAGTVNVTSSLYFGPTQDFWERILTSNTMGNSAQVLDSFIAATYRTAKYLIQINDLLANNHYASEILLMHDGTNVLITEYGSLTSNSYMGQISANIGAGVAQLWFVPISANTNVKLMRTLITS